MSVKFYQILHPTFTTGPRFEHTDLMTQSQKRGFFYLLESSGFHQWSTFLKWYIF